MSAHRQAEPLSNSSGVASPEVDAEVAAAFQYYLRCAKALQRYVGRDPEKLPRDEYLRMVRAIDRLVCGHDIRGILEMRDTQGEKNLVIVEVESPWRDDGWSTVEVLIVNLSSGMLSIDRICIPTSIVYSTSVVTDHAGAGFDVLMLRVWVGGIVGRQEVQYYGLTETGNCYLVRAESENGELVERLIPGVDPPEWYGIRMRRGDPKSVDSWLDLMEGGSEVVRLSMLYYLCATKSKSTPGTIDRRFRDRVIDAIVDESESVDNRQPAPAWRKTYLDMLRAEMNSRKAEGVSPKGATGVGP